MNSNEMSWLDLVKEHKWKIIVAAILLFAGISYLSMAIQTTTKSEPSATQQPSAVPYASASPTPTAKSSQVATASPSSIALSGDDKAQAPTPTDWMPLAHAFATAWGNPKVGQDAWLSAIKPTVTPDLYEKFTQTDISRMSQLEVSDITATGKADYMGVNATVTFKNTDFAIMIHLMPQADMTWLVSVVTSP